MLSYCPYCGDSLGRPILHGIASCNNCNRVFDSSPFHRLLSAAWLVRRRQIRDRDVLIQKFGYSPVDADFVLEYDHFSHEEFVRLLKEKGISEDFEICLDIAS